jgi:hypothetical protein
MEAFDDSPDASRHGGYSILRQLVAEEWRSQVRRCGMAATG